jgi:5-oxoprolinase (ATP-hydrolysing)
MKHIGIDIGGTFTDCNVVDETGRLQSFKAPSTPPAFARGVQDVLELAAERHGQSLADFLAGTELFSHSMTVATNTILTRSGMRVCLITTRGAGDTYELGRAFRGSVADVALAHHPPTLIPREDVEEVTERLDYRGRVVSPLNEREAEAAIERAVAKGIRSFAVCFLWSFLDPTHERRVAEMIRERYPDAFVSVSSDLTRLLGEYERTSTAAINSYVGPAVASYLSELGTALADAGLAAQPMIMRSDGGVATFPAAVTSPVNQLFSGPAGGLVGSKVLADEIGEPNLVTFDMGGTSTDVALIQDGRIQTASNKTLDRMPLAVPLIDIHSVAAGGGSIASVGMGGTLKVGPRSAGAVPGPCAYDRGGTEPTVTDADLVLGYIAPDYFAGGQMTLRSDLAHESIETLGCELGLGKEETAAGIFEVVNHVMADAIRVRTVERGSDPREFAMLSFGGAGGLHCCGVARELGISRIVVPRAASTFSALGLIASDLVDTSTATRHLPVPTDIDDMDEETLRKLNAILESLAEQSRSALVAQRIDPGDVDVTCFVQMCYRRQVLDLEVLVPRLPLGLDDLKAVVEEFEERYLRTYGPASAVAGAGYLLRNYKAVARATRSNPGLFGSGGGDTAAAEAIGTRRAYSPVSHSFVEMPVYRGPLPAGTKFAGPAIVEFEDTALILFEADECNVDELGNTRIEVAAAETARPVHKARTNEAVDPMLLEVTRSYEQSVNEEMARTIVNLSGSPLFVGGADYACACVTDRGDLLNALCFQMPMAYTISNTVRAAFDVYGDDISPGDMIFSNDPFVAGGLHPPDCVIVTPLFHEDELVMWVGALGHVTDVGGSNFASFPVGHVECFGEAVRFTPIKVYEQGRFRHDVMNAFMTNVRLPQRTESDLRAMMGANWVGRERMAAFIAKHGSATVRAAHSAAQSIGEDALRERLRLLPDGEYRGETYMEHDGVDDKLYPFRCTLRKHGDELTVDFTGSSPQAPGALNITEVAARGGVAAALAATLAPDVPFTEGIFRPLDIVAPPGTVMNAVKPAPISQGSTSGTRFGADAMIEGLNYALAGHPETEHRRNGPWSCWTLSLFAGINQYGDPWIFPEWWAGFGGASGLPFRDGYSGMGGLQYLDSQLPNIEEWELLNPALIVTRSFRPDSSGAGKYRGGLGMYGVLIPYDTDGLTLTSIQNRRTAPAFGVSGGHPGGGSFIGFARGKATMIRESLARGEFPDLAAVTDGIEIPPTRVTGVWLGPDDAYYSHANGGSGYGDPLDREPDLVAADVRHGWISRERARQAYAVVVDAEGNVDLEATGHLRSDRLDERRTLPIPAEVGSRTIESEV